MSLPDIDTDTVGHIAYWNALNHGASFLDPNQMKGYNGVDSFTVYQNGLSGTLERDPRLRWRAKTDGWLIVYYDTTVSGRPEDYAFIPEFSDGIVELYENVLAQELNSLRKAASNNLEMDFAYEDVGFADYRENPASRYEAYQFDPGNEARYAYTEYNDPRAFYLRAVSEVPVNGEHVEEVTFNGNTLVPRVEDIGVATGAVDAVENGWLRDESVFNYMKGGSKSFGNATSRACALAVYD